MITNNNKLLDLSNDFADCKISLWGGHIISYRPKNQEHDVFWMGDLNKFDNIAAIRGGLPICWPRFAAEELNNNLPRHGFARISDWNLQHFDINQDRSEAELSLIPDAKYNVNAIANLFIKVTDHLECSLETTNIGTESFKFSEALHAYFNVGARDRTIIKGLAGHQYKSSLDGKIYNLGRDLQITEEFDAAFLNHTGEITIEDNVFNRVITLKKSGSNTTIVWNPNKDLAEMSSGQYQNFICVEPANQGDYFVNLPPKQKHRITMIVDVANK